MMSPVIEEIVSEIEKLDKLEQQILLTRLRVEQMKNEKLEPLANPAPDVKPLTMEEIDFYKHEARKYNAGK